MKVTKVFHRNSSDACVKHCVLVLHEMGTTRGAHTSHIPQNSWHQMCMSTI